MNTTQKQFSLNRRLALSVVMGIACAATLAAETVTKLPQGVPEAWLAYTPAQAPPLWSVALAETLMARHPDLRRAWYQPWNYVEGYVLAAFERLHKATGDRRYLDYMKTLVDRFVDGEGRFTGSKLDNLDDFMTGATVVALYDATRDERYKTAAAQFRRAFDTYPRTDGQFWHNTGGSVMWIDGVFMGQAFTLRHASSIGDAAWCFDEAVRQITTCARHSQKGDTGLYLHAWTDQIAKHKWADPATGASTDVWSEGLGWYALVVADALAVLPKDHGGRAAVEDIYRRLAADLKRTQDAASGGWFMIVDKGTEPGNWIDPSGTGMFIYALQRGIELGLLPAADYGPVVKRAWTNLQTFARVNDRGLVDIHGGGDGICIKNDYQGYVTHKREVNAKETIGGFLWAAVSMERGRLEALKKP